MRKIQPALLLASSLFLASGTVTAQHPSPLPIQTTQTPPTSRVIPIDLDHDQVSLPFGSHQGITAQLWDAPVGGNLIFSEEHSDLKTGEEGSIHFLLGSNTPGGLDPNKFTSGSSLFLDLVDSTGKSILRGGNEGEERAEHRKFSSMRIPLYATPFALSPGPAGPQGPQGPQGIPGQMGPPGPMPTGAALTTTSNTFAGNQIINGSLVLNGAGNGITFPDGTIQTTSGSTGAVPSGSVILGNSSTPPPGYSTTGILGGTGQWYSAPGVLQGLNGTALLDNQLYHLGERLRSGTQGKTQFQTWDMLSGGWTFLTDMPVGLSEISVGAANGRVFAVGGTDPSTGSTTGFVHTYHVASKTWTSSSTTGVLAGASVVVTPGTSCGAGCTPHPLIWFIGGHNANNPTPTVVIDGLTGTVLPPARDPSVRRYSIAAAQLNGLIYLAGGLKSGTPPRPSHDFCPFASKSAAVFDPVGVGSGPIANLPVPIYGAAAAGLNGKIYLMGGVQCVPDPLAPSNIVPVPSSSVFVYDPAANTWSVGPAMPSARAFFSAVAVNGKIFAVGGAVFDASGLPIPTGVVEQFAPPVYMFTKN